MKKRSIVKTEAEVKIMAEGGKIAALCLHEVLKEVKPGVKLWELDNLAEELILKNGGKPSFKLVPGYNFATCININEGVVHGIPDNKIVRDGDIVSVDLGVFYKGFNTDTSWTVIAGSKQKQKRRFLKVGENALSEAIRRCRSGGFIGDVSYAIQKSLEDAHYTPSRVLVGHGIGRALHEEPHIPCVGEKGTGPKILSGMTLAVEVIYSTGSHELKEDKDGWTLSTADGSLSALFEHTVAVTEGGPVVVTSAKTQNLPRRR